MNKDYKELIEYLDGKFAKIDNKLDKLDETKADKSDVQNLLQKKRALN